MAGVTEVLRYEGKVYELIFLESDSSLTIGDRVDLCINAVEMKHKGRKTQKLKADNFEGQMRMIGDYSFGGFSGAAYRAKVETNHGKRNLGVMILS